MHPSDRTNPGRTDPWLRSFVGGVAFFLACVIVAAATCALVVQPFLWPEHRRTLAWGVLAVAAFQVAAAMYDKWFLARWPMPCLTAFLFVGSLAACAVHVVGFPSSAPATDYVTTCGTWSVNVVTLAAVMLMAQRAWVRQFETEPGVQPEG